MAARSFLDRLSDAIARFSGSVTFVVIHLVWFGAWLVINSSSGGRAFDPFPYSLLTLIVSLEAIFLSTFVLISQNRMSRLAERRAHLDLQINLLAESEMTKVLILARAIATTLKVPGAELDDEEEQEMERKTDVKEVMKEVEEEEDKKG
jgi:uncharacterized membrane protein